MNVTHRVAYALSDAWEWVVFGVVVPVVHWVRPPTGLIRDSDPLGDDPEVRAAYDALMAAVPPERRAATQRVVDRFWRLGGLWGWLKEPPVDDNDPFVVYVRARISAVQRQRRSRRGS